MHVAVFAPSFVVKVTSVVAPTVASALTVTVPPLTVATAVSELDHDPDLSLAFSGNTVGVNLTDPPTATSAVDLSKLTLETGIDSVLKEGISTFADSLSPTTRVALYSPATTFLFASYPVIVKGEGPSFTIESPLYILNVSTILISFLMIN